MLTLLPAVARPLISFLKNYSPPSTYKYVECSGGKYDGGDGGGGGCGGGGIGGGCGSGGGGSSSSGGSNSSSSR